MIRKSSNLAIVILLACFGVAVGPTIPMLSIIAAPLLVLFLPGYAITDLLFPEHSLGIVERLLFGLGLSLPVTALTGLILNLTPWGLQRDIWAITLSFIALLAGTIAWLRRRNTPALTASIAVPNVHFKLQGQEIILFGLGIAVTILALTLTRLPAPPNGVSGYTLLWMIPATEENPTDFRLGINSAEFAATRYRLQVRIGDQVVQEWPVLSLKPGDDWETTIQLRSNALSSEPIVADLYKLDNPQELYRYVRLWRGA